MWLCFKSFHRWTYTEFFTRYRVLMQKKHINKNDIRGSSEKTLHALIPVSMIPLSQLHLLLRSCIFFLWSILIKTVTTVAMKSNIEMSLRSSPRKLKWEKVLHSSPRQLKWTLINEMLLHMISCHFFLMLNKMVAIQKIINYNIDNNNSIVLGTLYMLFIVLGTLYVIHSTLNPVYCS